MCASFPSMSAVTVCFLAPGGLGGLCHKPWDGGLGTGSAWLQLFSRAGSGASHIQGSWMGLQNASSWGLVGAGSELLSVAAGGTQAISFTSTG